MILSEKDKIGSVLIIGGGIAGIQLSLDLAESGYYVYIVESSPALGGVMSQLDKTFPTNDCSMCILSPKIVECGRHLNIEVLTYSEFESIQGKPGNFSAVILKKARYIEAEKCTGCGECFKVCPIKIPNEFDKNLQYRKAIYKPYPQAYPNIATIDKAEKNNSNNSSRSKKPLTCIECMKCVKACKNSAINHNMKDELISINVGAVVLASGFEEYKPYEIYKDGYSRYKNVLTSIEFERMLSASGPFQGKIVKLSDNRPPKKIAFIQCIGSRDTSIRHGYCSNVCCMYAIKEACIAKEHIAEDIDITIFYMDIRCHGKDFEKYYQNARDKNKIRFVRSKIYKISEEDSSILSIIYCNTDNKVLTETYDMVVLSVGLQPSDSSKHIAVRLNLSHDKYGFIKSQPLHPTKTLQDGIFTCGVINGPKDIPETVTEASAAGAYINKFLSDKRWSLTKEKKFPEEINTFNLTPRLGVFVCHCGINISSVVNVKKVVEYAKKIPNVVYAEDNLYVCSQDSQEKIKELIHKYDLNRIVIASCSPRTHETLFQQTMSEAGLNKYLLEMANIRDQCSWVHSNEPEKATEKAIDLVQMAVNKSRILEPLTENKLQISQSCAVIGGGISGINAALNIAEQGFDVFLIEKESSLGGLVNKIYFNTYGSNIKPYLQNLITKVESHPKISVHKNSIIEKVNGCIGNYSTELRNTQTQTKKTINHGTVIIATGAKGYNPTEFLYGNNKNIHTQIELEEIINNDKSIFKELNSIAMIQCVGSRTPDTPYCSRVCCQTAIKNALIIKDLNPKLNIYIFYRDIRTYGLYEDVYRKAREQGIIFINFNPENEPKVFSTNNNSLNIEFYEKLINNKVSIKINKLILSSGIIPNPDNNQIAKFFKLPLNSDGFFLEAHAKLRPVDFATEGVFLAGTCHSPRNITESITQAMAASGRVSTIISKDHIKANAIVSVIDKKLCAGCKACIDVCTYNAIDFDDENKVSTINEALCKGCGVCAASCRNGAANLKGFTNEQIFHSIIPRSE